MRKMEKYVCLAGTICFLVLKVAADEGMWLPMFIERLNYQDMHKLGLRLTSEEIYSVNSSSLKDAVVMLNNGSCTGEMISPEGLMLTNHHCAYDAIQQQSSVEQDYLTHGFWSMNRGKELPVSGMTASFLIRMEDVTQKVLSSVSKGMSEDERQATIRNMTDSLKKEAEKDTHYEASVRGFFNGNEYYLFVYETFRDVRLAAAPPNSIGKFGGDTDNWMWPRHTGDFALLRVYMSAEGKPAAYAASNIPYQPKHFFPVSLDGVKEGDFAMVMGYPGSTDRYLTSHGVKSALEKDYPSRIKIREKKLGIMKEKMDADDAVRIKYSSKHASISNYYKYFIGQSQGLKKLDVYNKKLDEEEQFIKWIEEDAARKEIYGDALAGIGEGYSSMDRYTTTLVYFEEALITGSDIFLAALRARRIYAAFDRGADEVKKKAEGLRSFYSDHFKDLDVETDKKLLAETVEMYYKDLPASMHPMGMTQAAKKYRNDFYRFSDDVYSRSMFASREKTEAFLASPDRKKLEKDMMFRFVNSCFDFYMQISQSQGEGGDKLSRGQRLFVAGLREMNPDKKYYPNANSTMRLTYGTVTDYYPRDAVYYNYYTTLEGVLEKEDSSSEEFIVPDKLKTLCKNKDYGRYASGDGKMITCFIANTDITGGNSGSPVVNAKGHLIGCAFDGNWEAMSGDIAFEPDLQRTICVDIRYILFVIDKFAGAGHLLDEMKIVKGDEGEEKQSAAPPAIRQEVSN